MSKFHGSIIRTLRNHTRFFQNRTRRWARQGRVPSGWGHVREPNLIDRVGHFFYQKIQSLGGVRPGE